MNPIHNSLLERLRTQLDAIPSMLGGADEAQLRRAPASGQWSAFEHIAHLARHQAVFLARVGQILAEHEPAIRPYRAEQDEEWEAWRQVPLGDVLTRLHAGRQQMVDRIASLSDEQLARVGVHGVFGAMPLTAWLEFFLAHAGHHLYVAFRRARGGL